MPALQTGLNPAASALLRGPRALCAAFPLTDGNSNTVLLFHISNQNTRFRGGFHFPSTFYTKFCQFFSYFVRVFPPNRPLLDFLLAIFARHAILK